MIGRQYYVDTSVWGYLFEDILREKKEATETFFRLAQEKKIEIFISALVIEEMNRTGDRNLRDRLLQSLKDYPATVLSYQDEIEKLASKIVDMEAIPEEFEDDARHIGYAIIHGVDGLVSWNMKHIVRITTRRVVSALCRMEGHKEIDLLTPEEVIFDVGE